ncbi:MAG TPA: hypothetical protein DDZ33_01295 [Clostridium sp.]|nr:hypothetical protein [Clostridium sp.]
MKKIFSLLLCGIMILGLVGCGTKEEKKVENTNKSPEVKSEAPSSTDKKEDEVVKKEYYKAGEVIEISSEKGKYKFTILGAKLLPATDYRGKVVQVKYQYENIDFNGAININGEDITGVVTIDAPQALKVKDSEQNILQPMTQAWADEWKEPIPAAFGEKCVVEHTFEVEDDSKLEKIYVTFSRADRDYELIVEE